MADEKTKILLYLSIAHISAIHDFSLARPIREEEVRCDSNVTRFYEQLIRMTQVTGGEQSYGEAT